MSTTSKFEWCGLPIVRGGLTIMMDWGNCDSVARQPLLVDDEEPPAVIDLAAENYRFKLAERLGSREPTPPTPRPLIPILILDSPDNKHTPQTSRTVHFVPYPNDVIPRNTQIFDFDNAMGEYQEKQYEYQQYVICEAMRRCGPRPAKPKAKFSTQRIIPRISCERQPQKVGITLPTKFTPAPVKKPTYPKPALSETITISKVTVPDQKRSKSNRPIAREPLAPQKNTRNEARSTQKRYGSPPPRQPERIRGGQIGIVRCARGDYSSHVQQLVDRGAEE
jgi:hypothetical protein